MEHFILMADVVDSRSMDPKVMISSLRSVVTYINEKWKPAILSPLTITLGDEFQALIKDGESCYKILFDIEEYIVMHEPELKLRYIVNYGPIETEINVLVAHEMYGAGLAVAREQLNYMKTSSNRFSMLLEDKQHSSRIMQDLFVIYENYVDSWKPNTFPIVAAFLKNNDYKEVAVTLGMNRASAWKRYKSLNMREYGVIKKLILELDKLL